LNVKWQIVGLSALVIICATLGDMVESRFKRYVGVKDSGKMLPGHGGFLDRFDSVIFSIPIFFAYLQMFD
ncbi:MAG: phosphatidate cytidylyltransferase, partial [Bacteroidales bacterium]|nr:phosphatidate cytidylyltransferase [Bacteroidales bacterium]